VEPTVDAAHAAGADALVTVPILDHVAADKVGGSGPSACSGDVANSASYLTTRFRANVADKPGALSLTPNTGDGTVYQDEFVNWLEQATTGRVLYSLDNEPDLWSHTHARIHPNPVTYAELVERHIRFATAIKSVAPDAEVTGPANYGFWGFETLQSAPDAAGKGNFLDHWLEQMQAAGNAAGRRLVDDLDLHWYPEATGGGTRITSSSGATAVAAARVQAPRSLWDPTYVENSWITNDYLGGPIELLPTVQGRIDAHYPGTGIALTEWNYGGGRSHLGCPRLRRRARHLRPPRRAPRHPVGAQRRRELHLRRLPGLPQLRRRRRPVRRHLGAIPPPRTRPWCRCTPASMPPTPSTW
jgi:hypothetical protein